LLFAFPSAQYNIKNALKSKCFLAQAELLILASEIKGVIYNLTGQCRENYLWDVGAHEAGVILLIGRGERRRQFCAGWRLFLSTHRQSKRDIDKKDGGDSIILENSLAN